MVKKIVLLLILCATVSVSADQRINYYTRLNMAREEAGLSPVTPLLSLETFAHNYATLMRVRGITYLRAMDSPHDLMSDSDKVIGVRQLASTMGQRDIIMRTSILHENLLFYASTPRDRYTNAFYHWEDSPPHHEAQMDPEVVWAGIASVIDHTGATYIVGYYINAVR